MQPPTQPCATLTETGGFGPYLPTLNRSNRPAFRNEGRSFYLLQGMSYEVFVLRYEFRYEYSAQVIDFKDNFKSVRLRRIAGTVLP